MAAIGEDFLQGDDLDVILALIEGNVLEDDPEINEHVTEVVQEVTDVVPAVGFPCEQCNKVCKSQRGLTRHKNTEHAYQKNIRRVTSSVVLEKIHQRKCTKVVKGRRLFCENKERIPRI